MDIIQPKSLLAYKAPNHVVLHISWKNYIEKNPVKFSWSNSYIPKVWFALMECHSLKNSSATKLLRVNLIILFVSLSFNLK